MTAQNPGPQAGLSSARTLFDSLRDGDRVALARAITLMESRRSEDGAAKAELIGLCTAQAGESIRIGISGMPGAGKSTFIERMGLHLIDRGRRVAVLAVDPSSRRTGGSILGDKTRMDRLATRPEAFIRPSPSSGILGGVAEMTRETILLCEAAGYDTVLVETVGVGQSEFGVHDMVDYLLLLTIPGSGDALQGIKRGILEMADAVVVNKADGDRAAEAGRIASDLRSALRNGSQRNAIRVATASAATGEGIPESWHDLKTEIDRRRESGEFRERREKQRLDWFDNAAEVYLRVRLDSDVALADARRRLRDAVLRNELHPVAAAARFVDLVRPHEGSAKG